MNDGLVKGMVTGAMVGAAAATVFGVLNWEMERDWKRQAMRAGRCMMQKADQMMHGCW